MAVLLPYKFAFENEEVEAEINGLRFSFAEEEVKIPEIVSSVSLTIDEHSEFLRRLKEFVDKILEAFPEFGLRFNTSSTP